MNSPTNTPSSYHHHAQSNERQWALHVGEYSPVQFAVQSDAEEAYDIAVGLASESRGVAAGCSVALVSDSGALVAEYVPAS